MNQNDVNREFIKKVQRWLGVTADGAAGPQTDRAWAAKTAPASIDMAALFASLRTSFGPLIQKQVDGINAILTATEGWPVNWQAYALATAWHETAKTMQPIKEYGGDAYFKRMYDIEGERPHIAKQLGNTQRGDGAKYAGRGYVQLTGRTNYTRYGLQDRPDDAMKPDIAAMILRDGMENGVFTGKKLSDYNDYSSMRRIINGTDKAALIAGYADKFEKALYAAA